MFDVQSLFVLGSFGLLGLGLLGGLAAWGWKGWLELRHHQLEAGFASHSASLPTARELPGIANRIDLADLRERIKKLEAIAAGVDL